MSDLEQLIETAYRLSNKLSQMAEDERKFGWEMSQYLENMSYDQFVIANNLKEIKNNLIGDVA